MLTGYAILRAAAAVVFSAGIGLLVAGAVLTITPMIIAGILMIPIGAAVIFGTSLESRRRI